MWILVGTVGALIGVALVCVRSERWTKARWRTCAAQAGLEDVAVSTSLGTQVRVCGRRGALQVTITVLPGPRIGSEGILEIVVDGLKELPPTLSLRSRSMRTLAQALRSPVDQVVGDPFFDDEFLVQGRPETSLAILDADLRGQLCALAARGGVEIEKGRLILRIDPSNRDSVALLGPEDPVHHLRAVLALADALAHPARLPEVLDERLQKEPLASVRLEQVKTLARSYGGHARAREALRRACHDPSDDVRIVAAAALGQEGEATLLEIAERPGAGEPVAVRAIEALAALPAARALELLNASLRFGRRLVARALLERLAESGADEGLARIATVLAVERGDLAGAAAAALGRSRDLRAEVTLIDALGHADDVVRRAVVRALGAIGTRRAVVAIHASAQTRPADWFFQREARAAVAAIQARLAGAERGQVSLAQAEGGDLTIVRVAGDAASGRLTEPEA